VSPNAQAGLGPQTPYGAGRLSARRGRQRLLFGRVYEDSEIERSAFPLGGRVFCIASAGCTALALCQEHSVVACDINPTQIDYVRRRLAGAGRELGSAERIMGVMRTLMPLAGWSHQRLLEFLALDAPAAQLAVWRTELDTWRFRAGLSLLLSPLWLRGFYASALLSCLPERFDRVLRGRLERCFARHANRTNPFASALLLGLERDDDPPLAPQPSRQLELVASDAAAYLERCSPASFVGFSLSNILDGAPAGYRARLFAAVRRAAAPGARVVLRSFAEPDAGVADNRAVEDRSMLWGVVDVRAADTL
jgi:S-adenosylmethionine:diacylglycerol 3-amino-3-carboxypropyl transferase